eukprot:CFRG3224T1
MSDAAAKNWEKNEYGYADRINDAMHSRIDRHMRESSTVSIASGDTGMRLTDRYANNPVNVEFDTDTCNSAHADVCRERERDTRTETPISVDVETHTNTACMEVAKESEDVTPILKGVSREQSGIREMCGHDVSKCSVNANAACVGVDVNENGSQFEYKAGHKCADLVEDDKMKSTKKADTFRVELQRARERVAELTAMFMDNEEVNEKYRSSNSNRELVVQVATWNLGNARPPDEISDWVDPESDCDIIAVGVQESVYEDDKVALLTKLTEAINERYVFLSRAGMFSSANHKMPKKGRQYTDNIKLFVFISREHINWVTQLSKDSVPTGKLLDFGLGHNKGGVGISFWLYGRRYCFINSHLAAHQDRVDERNEDYRTICAKLCDSPDGFSVLVAHHFVFWMGDLNYRIDLPYNEVCKAVMRKDFAHLYKSDQLRAQRQEKSAFCGFEEGMIEFSPTFKVMKGTGKYDEEGMRVPSWCDRILWRSQPGCTIRCEMYKSVTSITSSDHIPVCGRYIASSAPKQSGAGRAPLRVHLSNIIVEFTNDMIDETGDEVFERSDQEVDTKGGELSKSSEGRQGWVVLLGNERLKELKLLTKDLSVPQHAWVDLWYVNESELREASIQLVIMSVHKEKDNKTKRKNRLGEASVLVNDVLGKESTVDIWRKGIIVGNLKAVFSLVVVYSEKTKRPNRMKDESNDTFVNLPGNATNNTLSTLLNVKQVDITGYYSDSDYPTSLSEEKEGNSLSHPDLLADTISGGRLSPRRGRKSLLHKFKSSSSNNNLSNTDKYKRKSKHTQPSRRHRYSSYNPDMPFEGDTTIPLKKTCQEYQSKVDILAGPTACACGNEGVDSIECMTCKIKFTTHSDNDSLNSGSDNQLRDTEEHLLETFIPISGPKGTKNKQCVHTRPAEGGIPSINMRESINVVGMNVNAVSGLDDRDLEVGEKKKKKGKARDRSNSDGPSLGSKVKMFSSKNGVPKTHVRQYMPIDDCDHSRGTHSETQLLITPTTAKPAHNLYRNSYTSTPPGAPNFTPTNTQSVGKMEGVRRGVDVEIDGTNTTPITEQLEQAFGGDERGMTGAELNSNVNQNVNMNTKVGGESPDIVGLVPKKGMDLNRLGIRRRDGDVKKDKEKEIKIFPLQSCTQSTKEKEVVITTTPIGSQTLPLEYPKDFMLKTSTHTTNGKNTNINTNTNTDPNTNTNTNANTNTNTNENFFTGASISAFKNRNSISNKMAKVFGRKGTDENKTDGTGNDILGSVKQSLTHHPCNTSTHTFTSPPRSGELNSPNLQSICPHKRDETLSSQYSDDNTSPPSPRRSSDAYRAVEPSLVCVKTTGLTSSYSSPGMLSSPTFVSPSNIPCTSAMDVGERECEVGSVHERRYVKVLEEIGTVKGVDRYKNGKKREKHRWKRSKSKDKDREREKDDKYREKKEKKERKEEKKKEKHLNMSRSSASQTVDAHITDAPEHCESL